jgi:hypothetical protein
VCFKYRINNKEKIKEIDLLLTVEKIDDITALKA